MEKILEKKQIIFEFTVKEITSDVEDKQTSTEKNEEMTFNNCSWEKFAEIAKSGNIKEFFKVGDKKRIALKNGEVVTIAIAGFDHDVSEDGKVLPVTLTFVDCLSDAFPMNQTATNKSGWKGCAMRIKTMATIFDLLPDDLKAIIVPCRKDGTTTDKLFLPSECEVWGKNFYGKDVKSKQYEFYKDKYNRIKFCTDNEDYSTWWWLRSPYSGSSVYFCAVNSGGSCNDGGANGSGGVAPCFAIC